jgi:peptidoglycan/LPS O-acetylase OafA/YrhL
MKNKRLYAILFSVLVLLLIPFILMQFTNEVSWQLADFLIMGILLLVTGLLCELVLRRVKRLTTRIVLCGIILFALFLIWAEMAVGIFGTPFAGS